ncbi:SseB family protein [Rudaea cellulosilytica]|uniref:SseB family protein n=1 Tax=Rudaea cellulosilytica TaxID=540746 RepID=UPI0003A9672C|nr:SseB family protein [Rudaea cellulosilytica]
MTAKKIPIYEVPPFAATNLPIAKVSVEELERLRERAIERRDEAPYFRALLDATLYAHAPLSDDTGRVRFIQFPHPDTGKDTLPFFTDVEQAHQAAQGHVKVLAMSGRLFFELTLGAFLVLNPNRDAVMMYPEEIHELLETGQVAEVGMESVQESTAMAFCPPKHAPAWLVEWLRTSLPRLPYVEKAYLVDACRPEAPTNVTLMIVLAVAPEHAEWAQRAMAALLQPHIQELKAPLDVQSYDPQGEMRQWGRDLGLEPVYERSQHAVRFVESTLEQMLQEVPRDAAWLKRFHNQLLESEVLVPVKIQPHEVHRRMIPPGSDLNVITLSRSDGVDVIPFFSSSDRLYQWEPRGEQCVLLTVRELFESRPDMHFWLNPHSQGSREFKPSLVSVLLKGSAK